MKKMVVVLAVVAASLFAMTFVAEAVSLPSYAQGADLKSQIDAKGKSVTDVVTAVAVVLCIIGIFVGAAMIGSNNAELGKKVVIGAVVGLILVGVAYSIAALALK